MTRRSTPDLRGNDHDDTRNHVWNTQMRLATVMSPPGSSAQAMPAIVIMLGLHVLQAPGHLPPSCPSSSPSLGEVLAVGGAQRIGLARLGQFLQRVVADGLACRSEVRRSPMSPTVPDCCARAPDALEDVDRAIEIANRLGRRQRETADKHAQPPEQRLLVGLEQVMAPVDGPASFAGGPADRLRRPPGSSCSGRAAEKRRRRQHADARGGDPIASGKPSSRRQMAGHGHGVVRRELEGRPRGLGLLHEKLHGLVAEQLRGRQGRIVGRQRQRGRGYSALAANGQRNAAGNNLIRGAAASKWATSGATAMICSRLSRMSSNSRPPRKALGFRTRHSPPSRMPSTWAMVVITRPGSLIGARSIEKRRRRRKNRPAPSRRPGSGASCPCPRPRQRDQAHVALLQQVVDPRCSRSRPISAVGGSGKPVAGSPSAAMVGNR